VEVQSLVILLRSDTATILLLQPTPIVMERIHWFSKQLLAQFQFLLFKMLLLIYHGVLVCLLK